MSGHSKWSTIKHKKGATDAKRGKIFTKLIKEITVAARMGGGDIDGNPRLRSAISAARAANMPKDNIERAIKKGTGDLEGVSYEEIVYEGYGPGGAAVLLEVLTDNRNRTVSEVRHLFSKYNGNMGESGCVAWMFTRRGRIEIPAEGIDEDLLMEVAIEAGAEDIRLEDQVFAIECEYVDLLNVADQLRANEYSLSRAEAIMVSETSVSLTGKSAESMLKLYEQLDDHDDVQHAWSNFEITDEVLASIT